MNKEELKNSITEYLDKLPRKTIKVSWPLDIPDSFGLSELEKPTITQLYLDSDSDNTIMAKIDGIKEPQRLDENFYQQIYDYIIAEEEFWEEYYAEQYYLDQYYATLDYWDNEL